MEDNEKKIVYKLKKQELSSEREERLANNRSKRRKFLKTISIILVCILMFISGYLVSIKTGHILNINGEEKTSSTLKLNLLKKYFEDVWLYKDDYEDLDETLDDKAFYGMTNFEDDPYTSYMSKDEITQFSSGINMNFVGIGVSYDGSGDYPLIKEVFKDSPAEKAGIEAGDVITAINGKDIKGFEADAIKEMITGEEGTLVNVTIEREGKTINYTVKRGTVDGTVYAYISEDNIAVLEINSFGENTANEAKKYLDDMQNCSKLVIDLRNNTGGYQSSVEDVASLFLEKDSVVMQQVYADKTSSTFKTKGGNYTNFKHIIILTNSNTASAAEVLTICLKELHQDAISLGTTTYGKGVVQSTFSLPDGSGLKITISKWLSPNGIWINGEGIKPDIEVKLADIMYKTILNYPEEEVYDIDSVSAYTAIAASGLKYIGYHIDREDGYLSETIAQAIKQYQEDKNIEISGTLNKETYDAINTSVIRFYNSDPQNDLQMVKAIEILKNK